MPDAGRALGWAGWQAVERDAVGALERIHLHPGRVQKDVLQLLAVEHGEVHGVLRLNGKHRWPGRGRCPRWDAQAGCALCGRVTTANATAERRIPPRDEDGPVGPQGEISMAVGPSLGNEVGGSSRDHLTGRCRRLLQRWRLRRCRVHRTRRDRVNEAAIAMERAGVCGELAAVSDRVCPYSRISKWLDTEVLDPCKRRASTPVGGSKRADFQRVDQASLRGNMTLRRPMAYSPQGG